MKPIYLRPAGGALLVIAGILLLLQNMAVLPSYSGWVWAIVFLFASAMFFAVFVTDRSQWWSLFPTLPLFALAVLIGGAALFPALPGELWGALFMALISLAFWFVFLVRPIYNWWAVIPGGVLASIAIMIGLSRFYPGLEQGGILFLGIGLTFLVLYLIPNSSGGQRWAIFPSVPMVLLGLLFLFAFTTLWAYFWPLALVAVGGWMLWRAFRSRDEKNAVTKL